MLKTTQVGRLRNAWSTPLVSVFDTQAMQRAIIGLTVVILAVLTSACSTIRFGYGQAPTLAYHWMDSWVDFDEPQGVKATDALQGMLGWHRRTQLPDYAQWLSRAASQMARDTTPDEVCRLGDEIGERWVALAEHLLPAVATIGVSLSDAQFARMQKRFDESVKRFRDDYAKPDAKEREQTALKRLVQRSEMVYGSLDDAQMAVLTKAAKTPTFDPDMVLAERTLRQRELMQMLKDARRAAQAGPREAAVDKLRAGLREWAQQGVQSARPEYRAQQKRIKDNNCTLSAQVHNVGGPEVRQAARERLENWAADARSLAGISGQ